jgi:hypothetical protein
MDHQPRIPRINVNVTEYDSDGSEVVYQALPDMTAETGQRIKLNAVPSYTPIEPPIAQHKTRNRANKESRKLLAHILSQLERRPMPPLFLDLDNDLQAPTERNSGSLLKAVKGSTNMKRIISESTKPFQRTEGEDQENEDDELTDEGVYSTDNVYELLIQLRDLLLLSTAQGWHILDDGYFSEADPRIRY